MKRRVRRKAPWERRTRGRTPEEDAHEHSMELLALLRDSLDDMGRPLTPLEAAIQQARQDILAERERLAALRRELPVPWSFPLAGWAGTPRPWLPKDRYWHAISVVLGLPDPEA
jgi:hypothetical protein